MTQEQKREMSKLLNGEQREWTEVSELNKRREKQFLKAVSKFMGLD